MNRRILSAITRRRRAVRGPLAGPADQERHAAFEALLATLPPFAQGEFRRRTQSGALPATAAEMFQVVQSWINGTDIAEGRGGYPGGRGRSGWMQYVMEQRRHVELFQALVDAFGEAPSDGMRMLRAYEERFPPPLRRMGDGYEPHVDDVAGRLIYSLPVDSSFVSLSFSYEVEEADLQVLLADSSRRAVLEVVAHTVLQRSMIRGSREVKQADFRRLVDRVLHTPPDALAAFVAKIDRDHNISVEYFVRSAMARSKAAPVKGKPPCAS